MFAKVLGHEEKEMKKVWCCNRGIWALATGRRFGGLVSALSGKSILRVPVDDDLN